MGIMSKGIFPIFPNPQPKASFVKRLQLILNSR